jgi:hypothetical protein
MSLKNRLKVDGNGLIELWNTSKLTAFLSGFDLSHGSKLNMIFATPLFLVRGNHPLSPVATLYFSQSDYWERALR